MKKQALSLCSMFLFCISTIGLSQSQASDFTKDEQQSIDEFVQNSSDIQFQMLPFNRLVFSERNGQTMVTSENGRYRFNGSITDTWTQTEIRFFNDAVYSANHLPLDNIGNLDPGMLEPLTFGSGPQEVVAFVLPDHEPSIQFLKEIQNLGSRFTFQLLVLTPPDAPRDLLASYSCPSDKERALNALLTNRGFGRIPFDRGCDLVTLNNRFITHSLLGFYDLPAVIAPSSRILQGNQENWTGFLLNNMK